MKVFQIIIIIISVESIYDVAMSIRAEICSHKFDTRDSVCVSQPTKKIDIINK